MGGRRMLDGIAGDIGAITACGKTVGETAGEIADSERHAASREATSLGGDFS